jgi:diacylglycerol kinase family enzyme
VSDPTQARRRALVIVNPHASAVTERLRTVVLSALASRFELEAVTTRARGHATELGFMAASGGYGLVVTLGGDGTANEAIQGLAGSSVPLTPLPGGSANVLCKLLGIPGEIIDATEHLLTLGEDWRERTIDLARVHGRYYAFSAGIGIDASVVELVDAHPELKARFGPRFFTACALYVFARRYALRAPRMRVTVDGRTFTGITTVVQNGHHYTYFHDRPIDLAAGASLDSGSLAGVILRRGSPRDLPALLWRGLSPRREIGAHRQVDSFTTTSAVSVVAIDRPLPLQLDGDYVGDVEHATFELVPGALHVAC